MLSAPEIDRWILSTLNSLILEVIAIWRTTSLRVRSCYR